MAMVSDITLRIFTTANAACATPYRPNCFHATVQTPQRAQAVSFVALSQFPPLAYTRRTKNMLMQEIPLSH